MDTGQIASPTGEDDTWEELDKLRDEDEDWDDSSGYCGGLFGDNALRAHDLARKVPWT